MAIGGLLAVAAVVLVRIPDPRTRTVSTGKLLLDAWLGVRYTWQNRTLRGLGLAMTSLNVAGGVMTIVVPIVILNQLHEPPAVVGAAWAMMGACGMVAALVVGRLDSRGRERRWLVGSILGFAASIALFLLAPSLPLLLVAMALAGLTNGPGDIALFTLRQRRTDPAWMGRAFAVSMAFNFAGFPIGSALTGVLVESSLAAAIGLAVVACLLGAWFAWSTIPAEADPMAGSIGRAAAP